MSSTNKKKIYENVVFFEEEFHFRIKSDDKVKIQKIVNKNQDLYFNESHLVRCAIIKLLRDYDRNGRRLK